ncbi:MAG: hypothetical protein OEY27_05905 [Gammaproteobacteria bacterium]|nr:hypothetical protein [Gammaproteobacteria bacterium]
MQLVYGGSSTTITIVSGRYYYPTEGYVEVEGLVAFVVNQNSLYPWYGRLRIRGTASSFADLTANTDEETFNLDVYPSGITSIPVPWNRWDAL